MALDYVQIIAWEQKPDLYSGDNCDQTRPRWHGYAEGDKEGGFDETIELTPDRFPPGTIVKVLVPACPDCGLDMQSCSENDTCDFDWDQWIQSRYS
jgi:hypothetical protein